MALTELRELPEESPSIKASPLPHLPERDVLSAEQWGILAAIADTVVPSFTTVDGNRLLRHHLHSTVYDSVKTSLQRGILNDSARDELVVRYLSESATAQVEFRESIRRMLSFHLPEDARKGLLFILSALKTPFIIVPLPMVLHFDAPSMRETDRHSSRAGSLLLTGHVTPLDCLPIRTREEILQSWSTARLPLLRGLHRSLTALCTSIWIRTSPTLGQVLSHPRVPLHSAPQDTGFPFQFLNFSSSHHSQESTVIETDVLVVGSGCGGAVAAKTLAEAGRKVLVVDQAYYWPPQHLPMSEREAADHLFGGGGAQQSDDSSIAVLAGRTWGGGGTVNWSASLQVQGYVRREWSHKFGLSHFTSAAFQNDMDVVCERMGVGTAAIEHNKTNQDLLEGARQLGWNGKVVPQNTGGKAHNCGYCTLGCGSCGKKGPTETFLPDAATAGAQFIEGFHVQEVLFAPSSDDSTQDPRRVTGVRGTWTSRDSAGGRSGTDHTTVTIIIKAPRVIISAGSLSTPLILLRSGLTNPHIGRHLYLHPVSILAAVWDEEVRPWEGSILTAVVNEFENLDAEGYGAKLEANTMLPGFMLPMFPWRSGLEYKQFAAKMKNMTGYISLARDRYGGRVYPDPVDGRTRIAYSPSKYDRAHILEGLVRLAEIMYVQGAREIHTGLHALEPFVRPKSEPESRVSVTPIAHPSVDDVEFQAWIAKLRKLGLPSPDVGFASAHQMGTCRMGVDPKTSVVDPRGRVWGTQGLYVADTSVFPSASGVNPMVTVMGIARGIARGIVEEDSQVWRGDVRARL